MQEPQEGSSTNLSNEHTCEIISDLRFLLNGHEIHLTDVDPTMLLIDYLRSPEIGLTGTKWVCRQGGCGACTVMLSHIDSKTNLLVHVAVNSCLRPLASLHGMAITTTEGIGCAVRGLNPVQKMIAENNGSQCGYCTPGFVMSMFSFLEAKKGEQLIEQEIEDLFDGNICRCTGYRSILKGMKKFANTLTGTAEKQEIQRFDADGHEPLPQEKARVRAETLENPAKTFRCETSLPVITHKLTKAKYAPVINNIVKGGQLSYELDPEAKALSVASSVEARAENSLETLQDIIQHSGMRTLHYTKGCYHWYRPSSLVQLLKAVRLHPAPSTIKYVGGNTSIGIYDRYQEDPQILIDVTHIPELHIQQVSGDKLIVGGAVTYGEFAALLDRIITDEQEKEKTAGLRAARYMVRRTAGAVVRNAATLAGNTMMVVHHVKQGTPFLSDLLPVLSAIGTKITVVHANVDGFREYDILDFVHTCANDMELARNVLIVSYCLPYSNHGEFVESYKIALREVNSHSIVNACFRIALTDDLIIKDVSLLISGTGAVAFHAVKAETALRGQPWEPTILMNALQEIEKDVDIDIKHHSERMKALPDTGIRDSYKRGVVVSFFYKFIIGVSLEMTPDFVPSTSKSAGMRFVRPVSHGTQTYAEATEIRPIGRPIIKRAAFLQATGEAKYTDEILLPVQTLEAAFVLSPKANGKLLYQLPNGSRTEKKDDFLKALQAIFPSLRDYVTADDIPEGGKLTQGRGNDEPILLTFAAIIPVEIHWFGQPLGLVLSTSHQEAVQIAHFIETCCLNIEPSETAPILTIEAALSQNRTFKDNPQTAPGVSHIWKLERPGSDLSWVKELETKTSLSFASKCQRREAQIGEKACLIVDSWQHTPDQAHFYMQPNSCVVVPEEDGVYSVYPASQSPMEIHESVRSVLGIRANKVRVRITRIGGSFGGKTSRSKFISAPVAVAAAKVNRPVRLVMRREADTAMTGKRHPYLGHYQVAVCTSGEDRGKILGLNVDLWGDGGYTYDCSFVVANCVQLKFDNAYDVRNYRTRLDVCQTNKASNTAFRSFGMMAAFLIVEDALQCTAHMLNISPEKLREKNFYRTTQQDKLSDPNEIASDPNASPEKRLIAPLTPFGQPLENCYIDNVWQKLKSDCKFEERKEKVKEFNRKNCWRKRGISLLPLKYGMGFNANFVQQGAGFVGIYYSDGTVFIRHGGVEMGQGLNVKIQQIASYALDIPLEKIEILETDTQVVPNPTSTGASTGASFNGGAIEEACKILRKRLEDFCLNLAATVGDTWCRDNGVDFWNYPNGWRSNVQYWRDTYDDNGQLLHKSGEKKKSTVWQNVVKQAYKARIDLSVQAGFRQRGSERLVSGVETHDGQNDGELSVCEFSGFTYSAACSEVEIDVLTGEVIILRVDILYDTGRSLNPAVDVGQVEGAFMQGVGSVMSEHLVFEQRDEQNLGRLNTLNTWEYKPPASTTIPIQFNVELYDHDSKIVVPDPRLLFSSKEVGEPPMVLSGTVYFAIKDAVMSAREERSGGEKPEWFYLACPATPQVIREACNVHVMDLKLEMHG